MTTPRPAIRGANRAWRSRRCRRSSAGAATGVLVLLAPASAAWLAGCGPCDEWMGENDLTECDGQCVDLLNDNDNCGECGLQCVGFPGMAACCGDGECELEPLPVTVATTADRPRAFALDDTHVYWTTGAAGTVERVEKHGGQAQVLAQGHPGAHGLALDDTHVYWAVACGQEAGYVVGVLCEAREAAVLRVPKEGGDVEVVAAARPSDAGQLAVDDASVYFTTARDGLWRVDKAGGEPEALLASGSFGGLHLDGDYLYVAGATEQGIPFAGKRRHVLRVSVDGTETEVLTSNETTSSPAVQSMALTPTEIIWVDFFRPDGNAGHGALRGISRDGGESRFIHGVAVYAPGIGIAEQSVQVAGESVYVMASSNVERFPLAGGRESDALDLACGEGYSQGSTLAVDDTSVYFPGAQTVLKVPR